MDTNKKDWIPNLAWNDPSEIEQSSNLWDKLFHGASRQGLLTYYKTIQRPNLL